MKRISDEQVKAIATKGTCAVEPSEIAGLFCFLAQDLAEARAENERLKQSEVLKWEANHQGAIIKFHGLQDEFPTNNCDAIDEVCEALLKARAVGNDPLESFRTLWLTYALEGDANLEATALELKRELLAIVGVIDTNKAMREALEALEAKLSEFGCVANGANVRGMIAKALGLASDAGKGD
jgi:hypothetical protein